MQGHYQKHLGGRSAGVEPLGSFDIQDSSGCRVIDRQGPGAFFAFVCLLVPRILSALYNIIHDCDEVYNYWEPLHFLLYGHGMQTWEYR